MYKAVGWRCMCSMEKLDNNFEFGKTVAFAHSVPVDMQKLIHIE